MTNEQTTRRDDSLYHEMRAAICQSMAHYAPGIPVDETTAIDRAAEVAASEVEKLKRHLLQLRAYSLGFVFTDDEAKAKAMPTSQRFAAIGGLLSRLATTGVLNDAELREVSE
ncbi:hypothetical protein ACIOD2_32230 [Amycolatopsis sp. NPDC088138]|uniref:hypothetical protein n=1 Tax=Amycolatopsis sp. NPDC088138 TaxID=3363938 RepID=UPI00380DEDFF